MKRLLFLACILCLGCHTAIGQKGGQARIDSLLQDVRPGVSDTQQAKVLIDLSFTYNTIDPDKGIAYGQQGLALSEKFNFKRGLNMPMTSGAILSISLRVWNKTVKPAKSTSVRIRMS